jgi:tetratricopeptide (TPR) repeat protein
MTSHQGLSVRDTRVLGLLFDPEAQQSPTDTHTVTQTTLNAELTTEELSEIRHIERHAVQLAEQGAMEEAELLLSRMIQKYPNGRPSLWNNRAQVRRLSKNVSGALEDLSQAIHLATPALLNATSSDYVNVLSHAHSHRATIYMLLARGEISGVLENESPERLEEYASRDFAMAGKYGSELAKAMAVRTNPYAKMCGAIVQSALRKEMQLLA